MRISDVMVEKLLKASGKFSDEQLKPLREQEKTEKKPLQDIVIKSNVVSEKDLTKLYAAEIEIPYIEFNPKELSREILKLMPERIARQYKAVVFDVDNEGNSLLALEDPDDIQAINFLRKQLGANIKLHIAAESVIQGALDQYRGNIIQRADQSYFDRRSSDEEEEEVGEDEVAEDSPIAQTVNLIIEYGVKAGASDIHIEPREGYRDRPLPRRRRAARGQQTAAKSPRRAGQPYQDSVQPEDRRAPGAAGRPL